MRIIRTTVLSSIFILTIAGCSLENPSKHGGLNITLKDEESENHNLLESFVEPGLSILANPTAVSDFNCFFANITGESIGPDARMSNCQSTDNMRGRGFGLGPQPVPRGQSINVEVPSGKARAIDIYGVYPAVPECGGTSGGSSAGYYLGGTIVDIFEPMSVIIPISYGGASGTLTCTQNSPTTTSPGTFGTGSDGALTVTASIADTNADTSLAGGRTFSAIRKITSIDTASATQLTVSPGITAADYAVGDEVMWIVTSSSTNAACSTTANTLYSGKSGVSKIAAVNTGGASITLTTAVTTVPSTINNGNMAALPNATHCNMQLVRIPHFTSLTLNAGVNISISPPAYNATSGVGGVLAMRVQTLTLSGGGTHSFDVSSRGFPGGSAGGFQGDGYVGAGTALSTPHGNGGGGSVANGGAGGANLGAPGGSSGGGSGGGNGSGICNAGSSTDCYFMGGGGGSAGAAGGAGGGVFRLWVKTVSGALNIQAGGATPGSSGPASGPGGGGGGTISVTTQGSSASWVFSAMGGGGSIGSTANGGGGGGGGNMYLEYCSGAPPATMGVSGGSGGTNSANGLAGTPGGANSTLNASAGFCTE